MLQSEMRISFAAIGKGYAADSVKQKWLNLGVRSGYVNASGDLAAFGHTAQHTPWRIGIAHPDQPDKVLLFIPIENAAIATSGDYEQHFFYHGKRYSHNLNPKTGLPLTGLKSVSIISPSAELSDALATATYVKGLQDGLTFVNQLPQTHCVIIDENNHVHISKNLIYQGVAI